MDINRKALAGMIASGTASAEQLSHAGLDFVIGIKQDGEAPQYRMVAREVLVRDDADDSRTISFIASDETVDRMGDIIRVKGWDLKNYRANPVILWQHDSFETPPIGTGKAKKGEVAGGKPALLMDVTFADGDAHPFAEQIFQLVKAKVLRGNSVGFRAIKVTRPESPEERDEMGLGPFGVVFEKAELVEDSIVSVPANPSAVALAMTDMVSRSLLTQDQADLFLHDAMGEQPDDYFARCRRSVIDFARLGDVLRSVLDEPEPEGDEDPAPEPDVEGDAPEGDPGDAPEEVPEGEPADPTEDIPEGDPVPPAEGEASLPLAGTVTANIGPPSCVSLTGITTDGTTGGEMPWTVTYPYPATNDFTLSAPSADPAFLAAVTRLTEQLTEQASAFRQLADSISDLARKVLDLNGRTAEPTPGDETGDEEIDPETLRSLGESLKGLAERVDRTTRA